MAHISDENWQIRTAEDIRGLGTILSVWAHPDDESFMAAGVMAAAVRNGQTVVCVTATKGEAGVQDEARWPGAKLGEIRAREMEAGLEVLGVQRHLWLDYADGGCEMVPPREAVGRLRELVEAVRPDTVLTFCAEGLTGHSDHQTVSRWASVAVQAAGSRARVFGAVHSPEQYRKHLRAADKRLNMFFAIDEPPLVEPAACAIAFELGAEIWGLKRGSLATMPSQTERLLAAMTEEQLVGGYGTEYFVELTRRRRL